MRRTFTEKELKADAALLDRYHMHLAADELRYAAEVVRRANEVRSDTLNGVVDYILNGG